MDPRTEEAYLKLGELHQEFLSSSDTDIRYCADMFMGGPMTGRNINELIWFHSTTRKWSVKDLQEAFEDTSADIVGLALRWIYVQKRRNG